MANEIETFDLHRIFLGDASAWFLLEVIFRTTFMFGYTLILVRTTGKRGLGELTPFELLLVVALGSAVGDPMFYPDVPLLHAMVVVGVIVLLQRTVALAVDRSPPFERMMEYNALRLPLPTRWRRPEPRHGRKHRHVDIQQDRTIVSDRAGEGVAKPSCGFTWIDVPASSVPPNDVVATVSDAFVAANGTCCTDCSEACWLLATSTFGSVTVRPFDTTSSALTSAEKSPGSSTAPPKPDPVGGVIEPAVLVNDFETRGIRDQ